MEFRRLILPQGAGWTRVGQQTVRCGLLPRFSSECSLAWAPYWNASPSQDQCVARHQAVPHRHQCSPTSHPYRCYGESINAEWLRMAKGRTFCTRRLVYESEALHSENSVIEERTHSLSPVLLSPSAEAGRHSALSTTGCRVHCTLQSSVRKETHRLYRGKLKQRW